MITSIPRSAENDLPRQSGSSGDLSAGADRLHQSQQIRNSQGIRCIQAFFQDGGEISRALDALANQIAAGVSLNQALDESGLRPEIERHLGSPCLQKILGMVREQNTAIFEASALGLASQLRKAQPQVAQEILSGLQQDPHVSKETQKQAREAWNANAEQGSISGRLGHWMQDTVYHMSGLGMVPVIAATAGGRIFETIVLSRLGPVATGMGARILVGAASLGLETTVAASGTYALNGGEVPLGLRGWATSLTALRLSGAAGNFLVSGMNRLGVARGVQSIAKTLVPHVSMYMGLYATNLAEGRSPDAIGLVGSVLSMQLAAGVGRGSLRSIGELRGELEVRREISTTRYGEPKAGQDFVSLFPRPEKAAAVSGFPGKAPSREIKRFLPKPINMSAKGGGGNKVGSKGGVRPDFQSRAAQEEQLRQRLLELDTSISDLRDTDPKDPAIPSKLAEASELFGTFRDHRKLIGQLIKLNLELKELARQGVSEEEIFSHEQAIRRVESQISLDIGRNYPFPVAFGFEFPDFFLDLKIFNFEVRSSTFGKLLKNYASFLRLGRLRIDKRSSEVPNFLLLSDSNLRQLEGLRRLGLVGCREEGENLSSLLTALHKLESFSFSNSDINIAKAEIIADFGSLNSLVVVTNELGDDGLAVILNNAKYLSGLKRFGVIDNSITDRGIGLITGAPMTELQSLYVGYNNFSTDIHKKTNPLRQLLHAPNLPKLDSVDLGNGGILKREGSIWRTGSGLIIE